MDRIIERANGSGHANAVDRVDGCGSTHLDLAEMRAWINRAIDEAGWNQEALAAHMKKDKAYISRVLSGEKPLSASFIRELPDDIEVIVVRYHAESFGLVVVAPLQGQAAVQALAAGLVGLLAPALPTRATAMAKAELPTQARKRA